MKNKKIIVGLIAITILGSIVAIVLLRRKNKDTKKDTNNSKDNLNETNSLTLQNPNTTNATQIVEANDEDDKLIEFKINDAKNKVLSFYEKNGNLLKDKQSGNNLSLDGTKTAYFMITKDVVVISNKTNSEKAKQRVNTYINDYLPTYFDKSFYSINADWYKKIWDKWQKKRK